MFWINPRMPTATMAKMMIWWWQWRPYQRTRRWWWLWDILILSRKATGKPKSAKPDGHPDNAASPCCSSSAGRHLQRAQKAAPKIINHNCHPQCARKEGPKIINHHPLLQSGTWNPHLQQDSLWIPCHRFFPHSSCPEKIQSRGKRASEPVYIRPEAPKPI